MEFSWIWKQKSDLPCKSSARSILRPCCETVVSWIAYSLSHLTFCSKQRFMVSSRRNSASWRTSNASCAARPWRADEKPISVIQIIYTMCVTKNTQTSTKYYRIKCRFTYFFFVSYQFRSSIKTYVHTNAHSSQKPIHIVHRF